MTKEQLKQLSLKRKEYSEKLTAIIDKKKGEAEYMLNKAHEAEDKIKQEENTIQSLNNKHDLSCSNSGRIGLLERIDALYSLGDSSSKIKWSLYLIMIFVIMIDVSPVFIKVVIPRGAYDAMIDELDKMCMIESDFKIEKRRRQIFNKNRDKNDKDNNPS